MASMFEKNFSKLLRAEDNVAGVLADAKLRLYKDPVPLNESTTTADLNAQVANYDGYAAANIDWSDPSISDDGKVEVIGTVPQFRPTGNNVDNDITGCYITHNGDNDVLYFGAFDDGPVPMKEETDALNVILRVRPAENSLVVSVS